MSDLDRCLALDASYSTDFVWQMDTHCNNGQTDIMFRTIRLPRSMRVAYPRDARQLAQNWRGCEGFWVADVNGRIAGYAALTERQDLGAVSITDLAVERDFRQLGVGTALVKTTIEWGRERNLNRILAELQTKNHPGICLYKKLGFVFCGFNDHYYANQDIAVFFALGLR